jgi:adenylate cyclase
MPEPPPADSPDPLSAEALAECSSATREEIARFAELGLIPPTAPGGDSFERGDVSRTRLLLALIRSGVSVEELAAAAGEGRFSLDFAGAIIADPAELTAMTHGEALEVIGMDGDYARGIQVAMGLPVAGGEELIREDDRELYAIAARARAEGVGEEALLQLFRIFAIGIRHVVEAQRDLYRQQVEDPMIAQGLSRLEVLRRTAATRLRLQRMGYRAVFLMVRRFLEQTVFENVFARIEEGLVEAGIERHGADADRAIVFIDLSGFTRLTEEEGDAAAARRGGQLVEIVQEACARHGGRLVKTLGDGVMLHFRSAAAAVRAALDVVAGTPAAGLPPSRAGIAAGPVVARDGDFFGRTVNLAARIAGVAPSGEVWVSESVIAAVVGGGLPFSFASRGARALKGLPGEVPVWAAAFDDGGGGAAAGGTPVQA